jgi:hypothetical protein
LLSPCKPGGWIELGGAFPDLKMEFGIAFSGFSEYPADRLTGAYLISFFDTHGLKVGINAEVLAMSYDNGIVGARDVDDTGNFTIEDAASRGAFHGFDVYSVVLHYHTF